MTSGRTLAWAAAASLAAVCVASCSRPGEPPAASTSSSAATAPVDQSAMLARRVVAKDLPLLPPGTLTARPIEVVKAVYEFAARHPEVLKYVPCFCGCERPGMNHQGNDDCFVAKRNGNGQVTEWEGHGLVCEICLDVGQMAMRMHNSGASLTQIREAVEKEFSGHGAGHTMTPMPAHSGKGTQH